MKEKMWEMHEGERFRPVEVREGHVLYDTVDEQTRRALNRARVDAQKNIKRNFKPKGR